MDALDMMDRLESQARLIRDLLRNTRPDEAAWRPEPARWSLLEVACHLRDEEREDFRPRLEMLLHRPEGEWPPIDPEGWVLSRAYAGQKLETVLEAFLREREDSLAWLHGLMAPDWRRSRVHPAGFVLRAGDLLAAWVAHDLLHVRQIVGLQLLRLAGRAQPYSLEYAGELSGSARPPAPPAE